MASATPTTTVPIAAPRLECLSRLCIKAVTPRQQDSHFRQLIDRGYAPAEARANARRCPKCFAKLTRPRDRA